MEIHRTTLLQHDGVHDFHFLNMFVKFMANLLGSGMLCPLTNVAFLLPNRYEQTKCVILFDLS